MGRHSVARHLRVEVDAYDAAIRRFIPGYEAMLGVAAREIASVAPRHVLDLGGGTGALAEAILLAAPGAAVELIDLDPEMLAVARERLDGYGGRARFREASFDDPLPEADAVAASLALHHVPTMKEKRRLFARIHDCLRPGGVFVNADATMPAEPERPGAGVARLDCPSRVPRHFGRARPASFRRMAGRGHLLSEGGRGRGDARRRIRGGGCLE